MEFKLWFFENADPTAVLRSFFPNLTPTSYGMMAEFEDRSVTFMRQDFRGTPVFKIDFSYQGEKPAGVHYDNGNSSATGREMTGATVKFMRLMERLSAALLRAGIGIIADAHDQQRLRVYYNSLTKIGFHPINDGGQVIYLPPDKTPHDMTIDPADLPPGFKQRGTRPGTPGFPATP